jgi:DNA-binding response OmpR family regulator
MSDKKKIILIVEDEFHVREIIRIVLEMENFETLLANNGKEALAILNDTIPDLIITDIMMPEMDGIQFFLTLKESQRTSSIPVFVLTVKCQFEDVKYATLIGVDEYMTKPFDPRHLVKKVKEMICKS